MVMVTIVRSVIRLSLRLYLDIDIYQMKLHLIMFTWMRLIFSYLVKQVHGSSESSWWRGADATFVVFDNIVQKFVGKNASDLYNDVVTVRIL